MLVVRKARGVVKTALSWGVGWAAAAGLLHPLARLFGEPGLLGHGLVPDITFAGLIGFFGGSVFATGLALSENQRSLDQIRVLAGTLWGAAAGFVGPAALALLTGGFGNYLEFAAGAPLFVATMTGLGAASGAAMTAIARQAEPAALGVEDQRANSRSSPPLRLEGPG